MKKSVGQESARGSAWRVRWPGPQRGQAARKSEERAEGRVGHKAPKDTRLSAQRATATPRPPQAVKAAITLIRERFDYLAIGLGEAGIRYGRGRSAAIKELSSERLPELLAH
jgi:hypothetical protein